MAIQKFRDQDLSAYFYDTQTDQVFSTRSGKSKPMKWSQNRSWYPKRVSMTTNRGYKVNYTQSQIKSMLMPAEVVAPVQALTNDLSLLKPDFEYVMFSSKNQCSQYFFAGTSLQEALDRFARRNEHIKPEDIRIVNARTGKVSLLKPQVVTTYALV